MVGGDDVQSVIQQGGQQGGAVLLALDRRVPLNTTAFLGVLITVEEQMVHADLRRNTFLCKRDIVAEEAEFILRGDVQDMQAGTVFLGQGHGQG